MTEETAREAFESLFEDVDSVEDQIRLISHTYDELMAVVDQTEDQDEDEATMDLLIACVGATGAALRMLAQHLEDTLGDKAD
jgi:hypothetical protein